jgi:hypothetical protein
MSEPPPPVPAPVAAPARLPDSVPDLGPPPPKKGLPTVAIVLIVLALVGIPVLIAVAAGAIATVATVVPTMQRKQMRFACTQNLSQLAGLLMMQSVSDPPPRSGPAVFLEWRKRGTLIKPGQESILLCPADPEAVADDTPEGRARWDDLDLDHPPRFLCSYAVRDFAKFPLEGRSAEPRPIAACLHHTETARDRGGAIIAFEDGSVRFVDYEELGISDATELTVGPDAPAELLRELTFGPSAK